MPWSAWRERVLAEIGGEEREARLQRPTLEGIAREPLYAPDHPGAARGADLPPLPRPLRAAGPWRLWQELPAGAGPAGARALHRERARDLGGVWIRAGRVGSEQLAVRHVAPLLAAAGTGTAVQVAIEGDGDPLALAAVLLAAVRAAGADPAAAGGCLGCDPLGSAARMGESGAGACEGLVACARWAAERGGWRSAVVSGSPYHDAGADAVVELGLTLATGADYLRRLLDAGLAPETAARQILLSLPVGRDFFLQVAKLRAARLLWGALFAVHDAPPEALRLHARTAWRTKTRLDPATDLVRATLEAMAAVVGGCDDLTCAPFLDPAVELELGLPLASATQLLLRDEAGLGALLDPAGGSWYVEALTAGLAAGAWELFQEVERLGGMPRALAVGAVSRRVEESAARRRRELAHRRLAVTGISIYPASEGGALPYRTPQRVEEGDAAPGTVEGETLPLARFEGEPGSPELLAAAIDAAGRGAGVGALAAALPPGSEPLRTPPLDAWRDAVPFEGLRRLAEARSVRPRAVLLRLASVAATFAGADLARQVLMAGGIEPVEPPPLSDPTVAGLVWRESVAAAGDGDGAAAAPHAAGVVVPGRRTAPEEVLAACHSLRAAGCEAVAVVGRRGESPAAEGADLWLEEGGDALDLLEDLLGRLEVLA